MFILLLLRLYFFIINYLIIEKLQIVTSPRGLPLFREAHSLSTTSALIIVEGVFALQFRCCLHSAVQLISATTAQTSSLLQIVCESSVQQEHFFFFSALFALPPPWMDTFEAESNLTRPSRLP